MFIGNTFDTLCYEVSDSGAWYGPPPLPAALLLLPLCCRVLPRSSAPTGRYAGRSWIARGNVITGNMCAADNEMQPNVL